MPLAYRPTAIVVKQAMTILPGVLTPVGGLTAGTAVGIVLNGPNKEYAPVGAGTNARTFAGFLLQSVAQGQSGIIVTTRGSIVTPLVEGGIPLVAGGEVWLAATAGRVTQTAPSGDGQYVLRLGHAISTTEMMVTTDTLVHIAS